MTTGGVIPRIRTVSGEVFATIAARQKRSIRYIRLGHFIISWSAK